VPSKDLLEQGVTLSLARRPGSPIDEDIQRLKPVIAAESQEMLFPPRTV